MLLLTDNGYDGVRHTAWAAKSRAVLRYLLQQLTGFLTPFLSFSLSNVYICYNFSTSFNTSNGLDNKDDGHCEVSG